MKINQIGLLVLLAAMSHAATVNVNLDSAPLSGAPGTALTFTGTLMNTTSSTVFLNAAGINLAGFSPLNEDTGPFFTNAPLFLAGGASTPTIGLFAINIPNPFAAGQYQGTFTVLGGADGNAQNTLGSSNFTVQVTNGPTVPEPGSEVLFTLGIAGLVGRWFLVRSH